ncbi:MAG TPA: hypothetical protein VFK11_02445 [Candidatus Saccharimonadales bacterium]|nr:hypothetical protein [Candidatus Saccharimonadales bacterium]
MRRLDRTGSIMISILIIFPFFILVATAYMQFAVSEFQVARKDQFRTLAQFGADAGIDKSMEEINSDSSWAGTTGEVILQNDTTAKVTYETVVTNSGSQKKTIVATGRSYRSASSSSPESIIKITADVKGIQSQSFSIITGVGGLELYNSAKVLGGDVFVNGTVTMTNSAQIGLQTSPINLQVAHQSCPNPVNSSYPQLCADGENGQPINIYNNSHIYGNVKANNQISGSNMSDPGLTASSGVTPQALPPHDRSAQIAAVTDNLTGSAASCSGKAEITWPANVKITGNVSISHQCEVTVLGDAWITGNLTMSNSAQLIVSDSLGTTRPNIMIDGQSSSLSNSSQIVSNNQNTGAQLITYWSTAGCSPNCSDVTGTDLYNTRNSTTISLNNSASGPQTIFYAKWSKIQVSNSGQIGALVGQTIVLTNNSAVTFGSSVGSGSITFWLIDGYRRSF